MGILFALLPVGYCAYLLYYFSGVGGSVEESVDMGLGPTMLGLGTVGLLFVVGLIVKILRALPGPRKAGPGSTGGPDSCDETPESSFDADAAIQRHLARKASGASDENPSKLRGADLSRPKPQFGRRGAQAS